MIRHGDPRPSRDDFEIGAPIRVDRPRKPHVYIVLRGGKAYVLKDVSKLRGWRRQLWRWLLRREARVYGALQGIPGIAACYGLIDRDALLLEYLPGDVLRRESIAMQRDDYFRELRTLVSAMHARGWLHLDIGHRRNVLVREDGSPAVVDLAGAQRVARWPLIGSVGRWIDRRCVRVLESRYKRSSPIPNDCVNRA